jgi:hypothetical protein
VAALVGLVLHGGTTGAIIEASLALGIVAIALVAWLAGRREKP